MRIKGIYVTINVNLVNVCYSSVPQIKCNIGLLKLEIVKMFGQIITMHMVVKE